MSLHLPRRSVAAVSMLILPDSWECSALPPAQLCEKEDSSVLSDDTLTFKGPPSHIRATTLWEIVPKEKLTSSRGTPSVRPFCWVNLIVLSETLGRCWTMPEATSLKPFDPEHLRLVYSIFQRMSVARTRDTF